MTKRIKGLLLTFASVMVVLALAVSTLGNIAPAKVFADGTGTAEDPYVITDAAGLIAVSDYVNNGEEGYAEAYYVLGADIDMTNEDWTPIGKDEEHSFAGHFDGQFHTISNVELNGAYDVDGIFGYTDGATIEKVGVVNLFADYEVATKVYIGSLVGYAYRSTINRCYAIGCNITVNVTGNEHDGGIGGLVGETFGGTVGNDDSTFRKTRVYNSYTLGGSVTSYRHNAGGLVGYENYYSIVENCYSKVDVYANGTGINDGALIGHVLYSYTAGVTGEVNHCYYDNALVGIGNNLTDNPVETELFTGSGANAKDSNGAYLAEVLENYAQTELADYADENGVWFHNPETPHLQPTEYDITYVLNGGNWVAEYVAPVAYVYGNYASSLVALPTETDVERAGYTFAGWSVTIGGVDAGVVATLAEFSEGDVVATANWVANDDTPYIVNVYQENLEGEYVLVATHDYVGTTDTLVVVDPETYAEYGFTYNPTLSTVEGNLAGDGSLVLDVYYDRNTYVITYDANGGVAVTETCEHKYEYVCDFCGKTTTRTGYTFEGWSLTVNGEVAESVVVTEDITVYAVWTANVYNATFVDYSENVTYEPAEYGVIAQTYDAPYVLPEEPTKNGYSFVAWKDYDGNVIDAATIYNVAGDTTVYAHWEAVDSPYTVLVIVENVDVNTETEYGPYYAITATTVTYTQEEIEALIGFTTPVGHEFSAENSVLTGVVTPEPETLQLVVYYARSEYEFVVEGENGEEVYVEKYLYDAPIDITSIEAAIEEYCGIGYEPILSKEGNTVADIEETSMPAYDVTYVVVKAEKSYDLYLQFVLADNYLTYIALGKDVSAQYPVEYYVGTYTFTSDYIVKTADYEDQEYLAYHTVDIRVFKGAIADLVVEQNAEDKVVVTATYYTIVADTNWEDTNNDEIAELWITFVGGARKLVGFIATIDEEVYIVPTHLLSESIYDATSSTEYPYGNWTLNGEAYDAFIANLTEEQKAELIWIESVVGPQGPQGEQGNAGANGNAGADATLPAWMTVVLVISAVAAVASIVVACVAISSAKKALSVGTTLAE